MSERYAIHYTFDGVLAEHGAAWLGWDIEAGAYVDHPQMGNVDLAKLTERPRKYGFHATIKAPFFLAGGVTEDELRTAFADLCANLAPVSINTLALSQIGGFLALTIDGDNAFLKSLAKRVVQDLDRFRAPLTDQELERRRPARLTEQQRTNLTNWGYPRVMDDFQFHVTLTGNIKDHDLEHVRAQAGRYFAHALTAPFTIGHLTLAGQSNDGFFHQITRLPLLG
jgi:hypothetical protein